MRIEDTDLERSSQESEGIIIDDLRWLGLDWDEGVDTGGDFGPYRQTDRLHIYDMWARKLISDGHAYPCYCTPEELEEERQAALARHEAVRYSGKCRRLTRREREDYEAAGRKPVIRFIVPERVLAVEDLIRGTIEFDTSAMGDFVIMKSNNVPTYNFACVVDDVAMEISHVIRADEHVANTPRQLLLYEALGSSPPKFAHVPMILGPDRSKLSKRHGATSVAYYREAGYLPEALLNYLALLGWSPPDGREILGIEELVREFSLERVGKSPSVFDPNKLDWMNGVYLRSKEPAELARLALPYLENAGLVQGAGPAQEDSHATMLQVERTVGLVKNSLVKLSDVVELTKPFWGEDVPEFEAKATEILNSAHVPQVLGRFIEDIEELQPFEPEPIHDMLMAIPEKLGIGKRKALLPIRAALTGRVSGPELHHAIFVLGRKRCVERAKKAVACSGEG